MKSIIITVFVYLSLVKADQQEDWYKSQLDTHVLPPYGEAVRILQTRILNELLTVNVSVLDDTSVTQLANRLLCAANDVHSSLNQSRIASEQLLNQIEYQLLTTITQVGALEKNIEDKQSEITQTDQSLQAAQTALNSALQAVQVKEQFVQSTEQALRAAENAVEEAKKCHGLLGKRSNNDIPIDTRGWLSSIVRPIVKPIENAIKDVVIKPVCSVINTNAVNTAKDNRNNAYGALQTAHGQVAQATQSLNNIQMQKLSFEAQLIQFQNNLIETQTNLNRLQNKLTITTNIDTQLKNANVQLSSVHVGSSVLQNALTNMIDFDRLLIPLNAIYTAISQFTAFNTTAYVPLDQIEQAKVHLAQIAVLVPDIPLNNFNSDLTCVQVFSLK